MHCCIVISSPVHSLVLALPTLADFFTMKPNRLLCQLDFLKRVRQTSCEMICLSGNCKTILDAIWSLCICMTEQLQHLPHLATATLLCKLKTCHNLCQDKACVKHEAGGSCPGHPCIWRPQHETAGHADAKACGSGVIPDHTA